MGNRILLVWDRLGDYHRARARALAQIDGCEAVYTADLGAADPLYKWENTKAESHFALSGKAVDDPDLWLRVYRFLKVLVTCRIHIVGIAGYGRVEYLLFILLAKLLGKQVVVFAESWYGKRNRPNRFKAVFLKLFVNGLFVSGERAKYFYENTLGLRNICIRMGYSVVENSHFAVKENIRRNMIEYPHILCVARFSREKNHERMIDAFLHSDASKHYHLKLVGDGPLWSFLRKRFEQRKEILFAPWLSYQELPMAYQQASAFVLASSFEPWGLVVNEAMAAGLPIFVSKQVGCSPDLVDETNGFIFDAYRVQEMKSAFDRFYTLTLQQKHDMGTRSIEKVNLFTTRTWAQNFLDLVRPL